VFHLFDWWSAFTPEERLRQSVWLFDRLPEETKKKIAMLHGFHPGLK
jgi:hypothetical protein